MRPTDMSVILRTMIPARKNLLFWSPPGCGKSTIIEDVVAELGYDLLYSHPVTEDATDIKGMPWIKDRVADFVAFGTLRQAVEATKPTVWFLDDFGQGFAAVLAGYMQALQARRVGEHVISPYVSFVAATNRHEDRAGVNRIITPVLGRFTHYDLDVSNEDFQSWAVKQNMRPDVRSYLNFVPGDLFRFDASAGERATPNPRNWKETSDNLDLLDKAGAQHLYQETVAGRVGLAAAIKFIAHSQICRELPNVDDVLAAPDTYTVPTEPAVCYALEGAIVEKCRTGKDTVTKSAVKYFIRMMPEYTVLALRDLVSVGKQSVALVTPEYRAWVKDNPDLLTM